MAGSSTGVPPLKTVVCRQARRSVARCPAPEDRRRRPMTDHTGTTLVDTTGNQNPTKTIRSR